MLGEPSGQPGHREDAERQREAAEHLHHAELGAHLVLRARIAGGVACADTTSVDIASATTSWITVPITISMAPRM